MGWTEAALFLGGRSGPQLDRWLTVPRYCLAALEQSPRLWYSWSCRQLGDKLGDLARLLYPIPSGSLTLSHLCFNFEVVVLSRAKKLDWKLDTGRSWVKLSSKSLAVIVCTGLREMWSVWLTAKSFNTRSVGVHFLFIGRYPVWNLRWQFLYTGLIPRDVGSTEIVPPYWDLCESPSTKQGKRSHYPTCKQGIRDR